MERTRRRWTSARVGFAALLLTSTVACGQDAGDSGGAQGGGQDADGGEVEITVGSLLPMTGDLAALGQNAASAVDLAVSEANDAATSATVRLVSQDTATQDNIAQSAVQQLLSESVDTIVGAIATCQAVVDTVVQNGVLMIAPACTTPQLSVYEDDGLFFRTAAPSDAQGTLLAEVAYEEGKRKAALITVRDSYGQYINERFVARFEELGGEVVGNVQYDTTARSFAAETEQLASGDPDAIVMIGYEDSGAAIVRDAAQRGLLDVQWYTGNGIQNPSFPEEANPSDPDAIRRWQGIGIGSADSEGAQAFAAAYESKFENQPPSFAAEAYDAAWIGILAATYGEVTGTPIQDSVYRVTDSEGTTCAPTECLPLVLEGETVAYDGATGQVGFDENGDTSNAVFEMWRFGEEGIETIRTLSR